MPSYLDFWNDYLAKQGTADAAGETRYQGVLSALQGQGISSKNRLRRNAAKRRGDIAVGLRQRGLHNTAVGETLNNALYRDVEEAETGIDESVADRRAGVMERHQGAQPNAGMYANVMGMAMSDERWRTEWEDMQRQRKKNSGFKGVLKGLGGALLGGATGGVSSGLGSLIGGAFGGGGSQQQYYPGYGMPPYA